MSVNWLRYGFMKLEMQVYKNHPKSKVNIMATFKIFRGVIKRTSWDFECMILKPGQSLVTLPYVLV